MTSDERALQYLADANPIPDPEKLGQRAFESVDLPATRRRRLMETEERSLASAPEPHRSRPRCASYELGSGAVLDQETARLLLDPDLAVGFVISREQGGISIGHEGANEGYRSEFVALPRCHASILLVP